MATMIAAAAVAAPFGLGKLGSLKTRLRRVGGCGAVAAKASLSQDSRSGCSWSAASPLLDLHSFFHEAPKRLLSGAERWTEKISDTELGKAMAPVAASAGIYVQASASALAEVVTVEDSPKDWTVLLLTSGVYLFLYLIVVPAIIYNYLRLRWYKRNAAETFFQFMLVFIFFPGMLLLAPFINFRRLPREGTKPP